jgi:hypothetical protein
LSLDTSAENLNVGRSGWNVAAVVSRIRTSWMTSKPRIWPPFAFCKISEVTMATEDKDGTRIEIFSST